MTHGNSKFLRIRGQSHAGASSQMDPGNSKLLKFRGQSAAGVSQQMTLEITSF